MRFNQDLKRKIGFGLASVLVLSELFLLGNVLTTIAQDDTTYERFGDITHYNGIIFNEFTSYQADAEGALAIGGYGQFGIKMGAGYDIGAAGESHYNEAVQIGQYKNPQGYPTLLYNGEDIRIGYDDSDNRAQYHIYDGPLVMSPTMKNYYETKAVPFTAGKDGLKIAEKSDLDAWFQEQYVKSAAASTRYASANDTEISFPAFYTGQYLDILNDFKNQRLWLDKAGKPNESILVINVRTDGTILFDDMWQSGGNVRIYYEETLKNYDLVIFHFPDAVNITFDKLSILDRKNSTLNPNDSALVQSYAANILWSFPAARSIRMYSFAMIGSVLAPHANLYADGGSINGQLICDSFTTENGMELHALTVPPHVFTPGEGSVTGSVKIQKLESGSESSKGLPGAIFKLEQKDGDGRYQAYGDVYETDMTGSIHITGLPLGDYRLVEIKPPDGYQLSAANVYEFTINRDNGVSNALQLMIYNEWKTTSAALVKAAELTNEGLAGAEFLLYRQETELELITRVVSGSDGKITITGLIPGSYVLKEITPPKGYEVIDDGIVHLTVCLDSSGEPYLCAVTDSNGLDLEYKNGMPVIKNRVGDETAELTGTLTLTKTVADGITLLAGAEFLLEKQMADETIAVYGPFITNEEKDILIEGLAAGTYRLTETAAPDGYEQAAPVFFRLEAHPDKAELQLYLLDENGEASLQKQLQLKIVNKKHNDRNPLGEIRIFKYTYKDQNILPLPDAAFALFMNGEEVAADKTDEDGSMQFNRLEPGYYALIETKAPDGYLTKGRRMTFEVLDEADEETKTAKIKWHDSTLETAGNQIKIFNEPLISGSIEILKVDRLSRIPLKGGRFTLYQEQIPAAGSSGELDADAVTDETGEQSEPTQTDEQNEEDGKDSSAEETAVDDSKDDEPGPGDVSSLKTFFFRKLEARADLAAPTEWMEIGSYLTSDDGTFLIEHLEPGSYRLVEISAPDGYILNTDESEWFFEIDEAGHTLGIGEGCLMIENDQMEEETSTAAETTAEETAPPETTQPGIKNPTRDANEDETTATTAAPAEVETSATATEISSSELETAPVTTAVGEEERPPEYTFQYDSERDEYLVSSPEGIPLGYVKNPDDFIAEVPQTGDFTMVSYFIILLLSSTAIALFYAAKYEMDKQKK